MLSTELQNEILKLKKENSIYAPFADSKYFKIICEKLAKPFENSKIDKVLGLEARGFILGGAVAYLLNAGFAVLRKGGKMYPDNYGSESVYSIETTDYSGKVKTLEIQKSEMGIKSGDRVLIVDDWFETGGQGTAAIKLVEEAGGIVAGIGIMLDDMNENIRERFLKYNLNALVKVK